MNGGWKSKQRADLTKLTAERCAGALLRGRFVVRVTWLGAASDCARGARQARCDSASVEASARLTLSPLA